MVVIYGGITIHKLSFFFLLVAMLFSVAGCQPKFQLLAKSSSFISVTRYQTDFNHLQSKIIKGKEMGPLLKGLNASGKHIVPKSAVFHCGKASEENSWYYDIVIHYRSSNRLFVINTEGCTFISDAKSDLLLNPTSMPDMNQYFQ